MPILTGWEEQNPSLFPSHSGASLLCHIQIPGYSPAAWSRATQWQFSGYGSARNKTPARPRSKIHFTGVGQFKWQQIPRPSWLPNPTNNITNSQIKTSTNARWISNWQTQLISAKMSLRVHSQDGSTFLHENTSWPPSWKCNEIWETSRHNRHNGLLPAPTCYGLAMWKLVYCTLAFKSASISCDITNKLIT